jgi:hypothetical protein
VNESGAHGALHGRHGVLRSVVRSPWFWCALLASLVTSPVTFLTALVLGTVAVVIGSWLWSTRTQAGILAVGAGLVLGSLPYSLAALRVVVG